MRFNFAAVGGTFDRFHLGHKKLLQTALKQANHIVVGITAKELIRSKELAAIIEPYEVRESEVLEWLSQNKKPGQQIHILPLQDMFGPTIQDTAIDVLVVTSQTRAGGEKVNLERMKRGLLKLPIVEADMVHDESGNYVSSTRIRKGVINRTGRVYSMLFSKEIKFQDKVLNQLKAVQGSLIKPDEINMIKDDFQKTALVGDLVTLTFLKYKIPFDYALTDGKTSRDIPVEVDVPVIKPNIYNQPGSISREAARFVFSLAEMSLKNQIFEFKGEEDLLALTSCLSLPLGSRIFYGQPKRGIVMIILTEKVKTRLAQLIDPVFI